MVFVRVVEAVVSLGERELAVLRPFDSEALLDEEAFAHEEFLPYWAELWPSGLDLARAVSRRGVRGLSVLELGCGLALPSIAAALAGARVLATDWSPDAVALAAWNARRNGARLRTAVCDWNAPARLVSEAPWDVVLAADVLYERRAVDALLDLLPRLLDRQGEVLLGDPGRPTAERFLAAARETWAIEPVLDGAAAGAVYRLSRPPT
jgi:predicted nicotinamide N-methyase